MKLAHVAITNGVLAIAFLVAGVLVLIFSDHEIGNGLIGTAVGLAIGSVAPSGTNAIAKPSSNGTPPSP